MYVVIVTITAENKNFKISHFLKAARSFFIKVRKDLDDNDRKISPGE